MKRNIIGFDDYYLIDNNLIFSKITKRYLKPSLNNSGYLFIRLKNNNGDRVTLGMHQIVYMSYNNISKDALKDKVINHIDGNKLNNVISNLELCSQKSNIEHAGLNKLTSKCIPLYVKDFSKNTISYYSSATECSKIINLSKDQILFRLKNECKIFNDKRQFVRHDNKKLLHKDFDIRHLFKARYLVKDLETKNVFKFNTLNELCNFVGIKFSHAYKLITNNVQPLLTFKYQFKFDNGSDWIRYKDIIKTYSDFHYKVPIKLYFGNNTFILFTLKECSQISGANITTLHYRLKNNFTKYKDGYSVSYY